MEAGGRRNGRKNKTLSPPPLTTLADARSCGDREVLEPKGQEPKLNSLQPPACSLQPLHGPSDA